MTTSSPVPSVKQGLTGTQAVGGWGGKKGVETAWILESDRPEFTPLICYYLFFALGEMCLNVSVPSTV